ncbi:hypothetical protein [Streptomyces sp. NPDC127084]|uniref:hypothetical protein n=1 Tax=Streptomyces sp. NPDC127084 TaxID=3347133 RepID=UPI003660F53F
MKRRNVASLIGTLAVLGTVLAPGGVASAATAPEKYATHDSAAAVLRAAGINWTSSGGCSDRIVKTCTSFEGINKATVNGIIDFKNLSKCAITITGGTEVGHAAGPESHANGYKVDIKPTTCVDTWIVKNMTKGSNRGSDPRWVSAVGDEYVKESSPSHWDITYKVGCLVAGLCF